MPTKGWKRTWVKLFVTGWLHGSIRWQLEPDERSVWADLICLAGQCGHEGAICDNDGKTLPRDFISNQLNIKQTLLDRTIAKSIHDNRLEEVDGCLYIVNWSSYQSEYERQKKSRQKKELSAWAKSQGWNSVEEYEANEAKLKAEGRWQSEEERIAEDAEVINKDRKPGEAEYTKGMFWQDNTWFEADRLKGLYPDDKPHGIKDLIMAFKKRYNGQYSVKDISGFVITFIEMRNKEMAK